MHPELIIRASTTDEEIRRNIVFLDMASRAIEGRDMAASVQSEQGDPVVFELHEIDGVTVLYSPEHNYAIVNEYSPGASYSLTFTELQTSGPEDAVRLWCDNPEDMSNEA